MVNYTNELREQVIDILKNSLTVEVNQYNDWGSQVLKVKVLVDGDCISEDFVSLPAPQISY
jgi:hypothetical protein